MPERAGHKLVAFRRGEIVLREGQAGAKAYVVKSGRLTAYRVRDNVRIMVGSMGVGQVVGELSVLSRKPANFTVEAEEYSELLEVDFGVLHSLLERCPRPVQNIVSFMVSRQYELARLITTHQIQDVFLAVCQVLDLYWRAHAPAGPSQDGVSLGGACRAVKNVLPMSTLEVMEIVQRLAGVGLLQVQEVKGARFGQDALGRRVRVSSYVEDRRLAIPDTESFLAKAKAFLESLSESGESAAASVEFLGLDDFAGQVDASPEVLLKKIGNAEIPLELLYVHKAAGERFAAEAGPEFFKKVKRKRLRAEDLEGVDDVVAVDDATLQDVFSALGFHKVSVLFAGASDAAREKIAAGLSTKMREVVTAEAAAMTLDETELADVEAELMERIKTAKGLAE
ncbi:MAG: cyclic nucleotide-binding domain-containing protein [Thermodesulfobacteriota bacterium]